MLARLVAREISCLVAREIRCLVARKFGGLFDVERFRSRLVMYMILSSAENPEDSHNMGLKKDAG